MCCVDITENIIVTTMLVRYCQHRKGCLCSSTISTIYCRHRNITLMNVTDEVGDRIE